MNLMLEASVVDANKRNSARIGAESARFALITDTALSLSFLMNIVSCSGGSRRKLLHVYK